MNLKRFFVTSLTLLLMFAFTQCQQEQSSIAEPRFNKFWTEAEIADYMANYDYPENVWEYERQFFGNLHRSQISAAELAEAQAVEAKIRAKYEGRTLEEVQAITAIQIQNGLIGLKTTGSDYQIASVSSYFFYVTSYDSRDWYIFDTANSMYGNMVYAYSTSPWDWDTNTNYMTSTSTTTTCRNFLSANLEFSTITGLSSSSSEFPPCTTGLMGGGYLFKVIPGFDPEPGAGLGNIDLSSGGGNNEILAIPGQYVFSNLNPSFENWTSGVPNAWQRSISSPYNVPTAWNTYMTTSRLTQSSTYAYAGIYSARISLRSIGRSLASGYFLIPQVKRLTGQYIAEIRMRGNPQTIKMLFCMALYDANDNLMADSSYVMTGSTSGFYENQATVTVANTPSYVRFAVRQDIGQNSNLVYVDNLKLSNPIGEDVSLPVSYGDMYYADYYSYRWTRIKWYTYSELQNAGWKLFFRNSSNNIEQVSTTYIAGQGNEPNSTYYDENFYMTYSAFANMMGEYELDVFLGCQDYAGGWEYFESDYRTIYP
jgi:hypothetical protein